MKGCTAASGLCPAEGVHDGCGSWAVARWLHYLEWTCRYDYFPGPIRNASCMRVGFSAMEMRVLRYLYPLPLLVNLLWKRKGTGRFGAQTFVALFPILLSAIWTTALPCIRRPKSFWWDTWKTWRIWSSPRLRQWWMSGWEELQLLWKFVNSSIRWCSSCRPVVGMCLLDQGSGTDWAGRIQIGARWESQVLVAVCRAGSDEYLGVLKLSLVRRLQCKGEEEAG